MKTYKVLYAEDVANYGTTKILAQNDAEAIATAKDIDDDDFRSIALDPDYGITSCRRIVSIEDEDGKYIAADIPLDGDTLIHGENKRRICEVAEAMFEALEAQEMAEFDPDAARRKGYFDRARELRTAALSKARGQQ